MHKQSFNKHFDDHINGEFRGEMPFRRYAENKAENKVEPVKQEIPAEKIAEPESQTKNVSYASSEIPIRSAAVQVNLRDHEHSIKINNDQAEVNDEFYQAIDRVEQSVPKKQKLTVQEQLEKMRLAREIAMSVHRYSDTEANKGEINRNDKEISEKRNEMDGSREIKLEERFSDEYFDSQQHQFCVGDEPIKRNEIEYKKENSKLFVGKKKIFNWPCFALPSISLRGAAYSFAILALLMTASVGIFAYAKKGFSMQGRVLGVSQEGMTSLQGAAAAASKQDFESSIKEFSRAEQQFAKASDDLDELGVLLVDASKYVPLFSKLSSGKHSMEAAEHLSIAGKEIAQVISVVSEIKNPISNQGGGDISLLDVFLDSKPHVVKAHEELIYARDALENVNVDDLPEDKRDKFILLKKELPNIIAACDVFVGNADIFADLFGANGPRKYLFLFQNNNEMRPTGGFIGSYGLLDISNGKIRNFFIDGIFNPDGQLIEKIVPPSPIQKMSAAWSLHDSNWWPDFPTSAREAIKFYAKTGGPSADGVITITPTVMQKFLEITGPIEMLEYGVTLDAENFIEKTQYEVEVDYDKEENKPKKILSDLAPIVLDKLLGSRDPKTVSKMFLALSDALAQKHILLYSDNKKLQELISKQGWSGEVLASEKDYLSVINTNINGFKTDGVVEETIKHKAEISSDGNIVDTVTITRNHKGGNSEYEWWNKVNCDYLRVYVPLGSKLLEVSGQTREFTKPPLDYDALGFKRDPLVVKEESSMSIDDQTGTRTYEESGKTVFANWAYVSPGETVSVTYKYLLPFKLFQVTSGGASYDSYSLTVQKQSGSIGSNLQSVLAYPREFSLEWEGQQETKKEGGEIYNERKLDRDRFFGYVFGKK